VTDDLSALAELASQQYVSLKTFKRDGSSVATPVWITADNDAVCIITQADSGKVKRIRNNDTVELAPCDMRGTVSGPYLPGRAELLDEQGTRHVQDLIREKYTAMALFMRVYRGMDRAARRLLRRSRPDTQIGIRVRTAV